jgi:hypothetical protein
MYIKDEGKCKQCDGDLPKVNNHYQVCPFCSIVDATMQTESPNLPVSIPAETPEPLPVIDTNKDKYCQDFITAMSVMGHLLKNKLVDQNRLRELIKIDNDKLSKGYKEGVSVINMTKQDFIELRNTLNKILANESCDKQHV